MTLKKSLVGAVAVVSTLVVAGCGSASDISGSGSASLTKQNFATAVSQATQGVGSVHMSGTFSTQGQSFDVTSDQSFGDGTIKGFAASITMNLPTVGTLDARLVGGIMYLNAAKLGLGGSGAKPWVKIDLTDTSNPIGAMFSKITSNFGPQQLSTALKAMSTLTKVGSETVDGVATTHYKATIDTSKISSSLGVDLSQLGIGASALPKTVPYDVWLDASSRPVKVLMTTPQVSTELHFSRWGAPVTVVAPPATQVGTFSL